MAEQNKRVKYKFGQSELDLKNYIHNLGTNVQDYLNSKNWSEDQKQEFMNAYKNILAGFNDQLANNTNRFSTDDFGTITDTQGIISNKDNDDIDPVGSEYYYDNDGNRITTDDYNLLKDNKKKNYKAFSANREVASYFNTIGNALKQYTKSSEEQSSNNFDLSKHGFLPTWTSEQNPGGGDFDTAPYIEMDQIGEDGTRQTSKRAQYLKEQLTNYLNNLSNYNYENSPFKDEATYRQRLQEAINGLENGYNSEDTIALNRAGINNNFLKNFFSNGTSTEQQKTELQQQAEQAAKEMQEREANAQLQAVIDQNTQKKYEDTRDQYFNEFQKNNPFKNTINSQGLPLSYNINTVLNTLKIPNGLTNEQVAEKIKQYVDFGQLSKFIRGNIVAKDKEGKDRTLEHISNNLDLAAQYNLFNDPKYLTNEGKSILSDGYYVIPGSEDYDRWTFLAYNPQTRQYQEQSMLLNDLLKERMAYSEYDRRNKIQKKQLGGGFEVYQKRNKDSEETKQKSKESGRTEEQAKAGQRKPGETGFTTLEHARIASAIMDIGSILAAFVPGYGTVGSAGLGLASTATNLVADINDDSMSGLDVAKNLGFGLAGDIAGLIPGIGALGKAGKIAKTLKYVAPTAIAAWGAYENGTAPIKAMNKLMSDETLTVDDWKALSAGLQMLAGGVRLVKGNNTVNKIKNSKEAVPYNTITVKSGNTYKVDRNQYNKITSASTLEDQNKALREAIKNDSEELGSKFKTSKWEKVKHPFTQEPKTSKGVDYKDKNIDYTKQERIPWQYKANKETGEIKPRFLSDEWILQRTGNWTFGDPNINLFTRKNPLYKKEQINTSQTPTVNAEKPISSIKPGSGPNIKQLRVWSRTPGYAKTQGYGRDFGIGQPKKTKNEIKLGIEFDKKGGTLNLSNVRKFQNGKTITNTTSKADWFNDMFSSDAMQKWIDAYTLNDYQKFNDLQKSWSANKKATQYVPGATPLAWNQGVQDRQKLWEQTGTNATIEDLVSNGVITRSGKSGDNAEGGHVDGYFGEQEYLRHGGTEDSWKGHEDELTKFQEMLKKKGLQYTLDPETGMYLMSPIKQQVRQNFGSTNLNVAEQEEEEEEEEDDSSVNGSWKDIFTKALSNPTITYGLPRALYADRTNRKITDLAQELDALQKDPFQVHRYTRSDLDAEMQGVRNYAKLRNLANTNLTSDADKQKSYQFESESKGIDYINAGKEKSNQVERQYEELAWQQEKENAANRHQTAMFNREQQWQDKYRDNLYEQAYLNKKHNIWDTLAQQIEFDVRQKLAETKDIRDNFTRSDIHNSVMYNPNKYGANLTNEELQVWKQIMAGVQPSSLQNDANKLKLLYSAQKKISQAEQNQLKQYYNIPQTKWTNARQYSSPSFTPKIFLVRKGQKIKSNLADIREFQKQIKEGIKRSDKAIERLFKYVNKKK